jgi:hypothetical protein
MLGYELLQKLSLMSMEDLDKPVNIYLVDEFDGEIEEQRYGISTDLKLNKESIDLTGIIVYPIEL